jgi:hypothetical protein
MKKKCAHRDKEKNEMKWKELMRYTTWDEQFQHHNALQRQPVCLK